LLTLLQKIGTLGHVYIAELECRLDYSNNCNIKVFFHAYQYSQGFISFTFVL